MTITIINAAILFAAITLFAFCRRTSATPSPRRKNAAYVERHQDHVGFIVRLDDGCAVVIEHKHRPGEPPAIWFTFRGVQTGFGRPLTVAEAQDVSEALSGIITEIKVEMGAA